MKNIYLLFLVLTLPVLAQPKTTLTPTGFTVVEIPCMGKTAEKLTDASKAWADYYNKDEYDVYDITPNSLKIDALRDNAFYYRNRGERYDFRIRYTLKITFLENTIAIAFGVKEIYTQKSLTSMTIADFFASDGRLKEDYEEVRPSLEATANAAIRSYTSLVSAY